jgi:hypothetical protein
MDDAPERTVPTWVARLFLAPLVVAAILMAWAGLRIVEAGSALVGIGLIIVAAITAVLVVRRIMQVRPGQRVDPVSGDLPRVEFDYIIWWFVVPFILLGLFLLDLVIDAANGP